MKHNAIVPAVAIALLTTSASLAQPDDRPTLPAEPPPALPADPVPADPPRSADILAEALRPTPGGLTMDAVAQRAVGTSRVVAQKRAEIEAAAAELDVALVAYFPTATLTASYTRLSPVDNTLSTGPGQPAITIPSLLNSYAFSAGLVVPISDYALRLSQQYASASGSEQARQIEARAEALNAAADAKIALLEWVRARGQQAVASMAVAEARAHVAQTEVLVDAGVASRADLLRLQAQLAEAEHLERAAGVLVSLTENQLRVVLHLEASTPMSSAVDVLAQPPGEMRSLQSLEREALAQRLDLRALDQSERALDEADTAAHAGYYPRLDAFANALLANPNPRVFSQSNSFDMTWDVG